MKQKSKVKCLCKPQCRNIEVHIKKLKRLGETDKIILAMIRSGELKSKIDK